MDKTIKLEEYPYYYFIDAYSIGNSEKAELGETAFAEALIDFPVMMNVTYGKRQKDIDHLVFTYDSVVMNECKNTNENFEMYQSWLLSHVVDRFADGYPVAQYYAQTAGYHIKNVKFTLTIPKLNCGPLVKATLRGLKIHVVETGVQLLRKEDKQLWYEPVRSNLLSVINNIQDNTRVPIDSNSSNGSFLAPSSDVNECIFSERRNFGVLKK